MELAVPPTAPLIFAILGFVGIVGVDMELNTAEAKYNMNWSICGLSG